MKQYRVRLTDEAELDLVDIYSYVNDNDSIAAADYLLDELERLCSALSDLPQLGHMPTVLDRVAVTNYLEVHFKPYRVIYEVIGREVIVHGIVDGRRDMQSLLERRLLR